MCFFTKRSLQKLLPSGRRPNKRRELVSSVNDAMETALHGVADVIDLDMSIQGEYLWNFQK